MAVPNKFPTVPHPSCRIAIVGEAPGQDEELCGEPFVGTSGKLLRGIIGQSGLALEQCLVANVCQIRPPKNELHHFSWDGPEITSGIAQLVSDLNTYQPNAILALGKAAMRALCPDQCDGDKVPLANFRGSIIPSTYGPKTILSYHPAYIQRSYSDIPYFRFDVARAVEQARYPELRNTPRVGLLTPTLTELVDYLYTLRLNHTACSLDIEGYPDHTGITCMSICPTPFTGIVIPFWHRGHNYWSDSEEPIVWAALSDYLADGSCSKTCHNGFYEFFVYAWRHKILLNGFDNDTMLMFWELYPELEKNLGVVNSFCTEEPYYKDERLSHDPDVRLQYNFKDSAVTDESKRNLEVTLQKTPASYEHYRFNICISPAVSYLNLRGCRLDRDRLTNHRTRVALELNELQVRIDDRLIGPACDAGVLRRKNKSTPFTFNVKGKCVEWFLYDHLGYKPSQRYGRCHDEETLLGYYTKHRDPTLLAIIQAVRKRTRLQDIEKFVCDADGRIRTTLDIVGTNTGRSSSRYSMSMRPSPNDPTEWENVGTNLQNVTKDLRDVFVPDTDQFDFWQFDLRGADAWTVAADLAALGYPTMLEDMLAGIKPAKVLMALLQEQEAGRNPAVINNLDRDALKRHLETINIPPSSDKDSQGRPGDWKYDVCKKVQHGTNYDAKSPTIASLVFVDSDGLVDLSPADASIYQTLYKMRYRPEVRNQWITRELSDHGYLVAACGIRRKFFGIRNPRDIDADIVRQASAFEPQANTTYCTNNALKNLWYDPENRTSSGWLHVDPLLQIHDALAGQNHSAIREWAHTKLRSYFQTTLRVHGIDVTIPADGGWGTDWLNTKNKLL